MKTKPILALAGSMLVLAACASTNTPPPNLTQVKTGFIVEANKDEEATTLTVGMKDKFLVRNVRPALQAVLEAPFTYTDEKRTITIPEGTPLFGSAGSRPSGSYRLGADTAAETETPLTLGGEGSATARSRPRSRREIVTIYCGLLDRKINGDEAITAILTLGLTLSKRQKFDIFCLEDTNKDGSFDRVWDSNLTYDYPPTISAIHTDREVEPVAYKTTPAAEIEPIGQLWLQINKHGGLFNRTVKINGRIGRGDDYIEFDNLRRSLNLNEDGSSDLTNFFGARYRIHATDDETVHRVDIIPATKNASVSLSKTVYYSRQTTYIPIFVP